MAAMPDDAWDATSRTVTGVETDARAVVFSRWREVAVHHGDLALRPEPLPLPPALVEAWLPTELAGLAARTDPVALLSWILGRGAAPPLDPW